MVQNNKVLTVSYGTFSCTLEGFDDSFDTMKAIAEYFRDLAGEDRYFGAEPPQPDAEMLARIAQKEISRQVEARHGDDGIVLRAAQSRAPAIAAGPIAAEAALDVTTDIPSDVEPESASETMAYAEQSDQVDTAPEPEVAVDPAPVEAQAHSQVDAIDNDDDDIESLTTAPEPAPENEVEVEVEAEKAIELPDATEAADADDVATFDAEDVAPEDDIVPAADSIAAKLQRIREVVSRKPQSDETMEFSEDEHADAFVAEDAEEITDLLRAADEGEPVEPQADQDADDIDAVLAQLSEPDEDQNTAVHDHDAPVGEDSIFGEFDEDDFEDDEDELLNILNAPEEAAEDVASVMPATPTRVRVSKVKRAAVDAAVAAGTLEEFQPDANDDVSDGSLSAEDEQDLARELAEVEAEAALSPMTEDAGYDIEDDEVYVAEQAADPDATFADPAPESGQDLSRLMAAADEKLGEAEGSSNRETFTQLRAVVAAAAAERQAGGTVGTENDPEPYKADLANVVRPRRPVAGSGRAERPVTPTRAAPLKLVAEQRIDTPREDTGPVRPRRIRNLDAEGATPGSDDTAGGFADYAAERGAVELPDVFEAAAAYLSFVEGREQFSRPQLMSKVRQLELPGFNREDGLRSFGQILRDGKIEKIGSGRFMVADDIGFRPDTRAAG